VKKIVDYKSQEIKREEEIRKSLMIKSTPEVENINDTMLSNQGFDDDETQSEDKKDIDELKE
jgi:hypothetical protein